MIVYLLCSFLFVLGLYCLVAKKNIIKKIIGIITMEYSVNLFLVLVGYRARGIAPILSKGADKAEFIAKSVDPLPQALVLTAIVIGLGTIALMVAICIRLYERYGTFDMTEIRRLRG
ncbi:NADH-quinone oxidoreductase subunit K [bacterium]|nr:NADH-quinone oxidoreductase subunit K [bacterium]